MEVTLRMTTDEDYKKHTQKYKYGNVYLVLPKNEDDISKSILADMLGYKNEAEAQIYIEVDVSELEDEEIERITDVFSLIEYKYFEGKHDRMMGRLSGSSYWQNTKEKKSLTLSMQTATARGIDYLLSSKRKNYYPEVKDVLWGK